MARPPDTRSYWRVHAVTTRIRGVRVPVLQITGWYDDSRGPIDYTDALQSVPGHPLMRLVIGPWAHQGLDHVAGDYGTDARVDDRLLQLRWFDHYLKGIDNGVDREPPVDVFVIGDNQWRRETSGRSPERGRRNSSCIPAATQHEWRRWLARHAAARGRAA